ncbi:myelin-associated glycoprotein-like isoform X2 [Poeciliopsis prolifica]|uniref:myelin-associated glycoprotein-like isoform X2 n=1 Tax=Poeciliopsis prolifica TaxID=188132 RepID=UPI002413559D|nr:myelin-associated glycoprotein-like isoform X2 [Poeciliopsis prolifica]
MKKLCHLYNNILIVGILLIVFVPPGAVAHCRNVQDLHVYLPAEEVEALVGSCFDIPCRYDPLPLFDSTKPIYGIWMKHVKDYLYLEDSQVYYNSSGTVNSHQMQLTGDLRRHNCTTRISNLTPRHADSYMLRIENVDARATFCDDFLTLKVVDSPRPPIIVVSGQKLKERQSVTVSCSANTPCLQSPPELTWNISQHSTRILQQKKDDIFMTTIQKTITLTHHHDGYIISCSARYPVKGEFKQSPESVKTLSVSYSPKGTDASIDPASVVSEGTWVTLMCTSKANPPIRRFSWFKKSRKGPIKVSENPTYSFTATPTAEGNYFCEATNAIEAPKNTKAYINQAGLLTTGTWVELTCETEATTQVNFTWFRNNKDGTTKLTTDQFHSFSASPANEGDYYCEASNKRGSDTSRRFCIDTRDAPFIPSINIPVGEWKEDQSVTITCSVSTPCPQSQPGLTWNLKQDSLRQTEKNTEGRFTTKIQETITLSDKHDGYIISCSTRHPADLEDKTAEKDETLRVLYAPKATSASISPSSLLSEGNWVELICSTRANPPPKITWFKKGSKMFSKISTGIIIKVKFTEGNEYYCEAENELGKQRSSPITLRVKSTAGVLIYALLGVLGLAALGIMGFLLDKWYKQTS